MTSKDIPEHHKKENDQRNIIDLTSQSVPRNENEKSKMKIKSLSPVCWRKHMIGDSILKHVQGYENSKSL